MPIVYGTGATPLAKDLFRITPALAFAVDAIIDASTEKIALVGNVWHPTIRTGTINLRKVLFRTGAVSLGANSEIRVSLQNVSLTAGPPFQPDGVQDQFYDFKTATAVLAANTWQSTGNLSADRAVDLAAVSAGTANSRRLAVVIEYQAFTAADSVIISATPADAADLSMSGVELFTGSWAVLVRNANLAFECDDGSFAFLSNSSPLSAITSVAVNSTGAIRRAGVKFRFPVSRMIDRIAMTITAPNNCDGRLVLYAADGTTELASVDMDNDDMRGTGVTLMDVPIVPVLQPANTYFRLAFVGGTSTASAISVVDVSTAALMDGLVFGQDAFYTQHDGSAWADTTTRRPQFGIGTCGVDTGLAANPMRGFVG
jgi:hypothetical protein